MISLSYIDIKFGNLNFNSNEIYNFERGYNEFTILLLKKRV